MQSIKKLLSYLAEKIIAIIVIVIASLISWYLLYYLKHNEILTRFSFEQEKEKHFDTEQTAEIEREKARIVEENTRKEIEKQRIVREQVEGKARIAEERRQVDEARSRPISPIKIDDNFFSDLSSSAWEVYNGDWKITNEILMSQGGHIDSEILYKKLFSDNYTAQVDTIVLDGPGKSAITFCHTGEDHFYQLEISASDNKAFLWQSGNWQKLAQSTLPIKFNNWYRLKVKLSDGKAYLYVDDQMLFSKNVLCNHYHYLGLRSAWTTSQFKNFLVNTQR